MAVLPMNIKYRPEIDGLRAIAVLAVVFYHAEFALSGTNLFTGGFVGVDVFFVISGYLITSIILTDLEKNRFSFRRFYERRARRILPALLVVMLASIPFAWVYLLPSAMEEYAGSVLSSIFFGSNFWFWGEDSYWAEPSALKPFLHTWSLSVEEQFYVIFPLVLLLLWKVAKRRIAALFLLGFISSLVLSDFWTDIDANSTFYLLPARMWELLAGAMLAKLELDRGRVSHAFLGRITPALGVLLIAYAVAFFDEDTKHPAFATLLPVAGTMMLIWFAKPNEPVSDALGSRFFVGIGLISYSLYLWHYPIFAFGRIRGDTPSPYDKLGWIILSVLLALITFRFIEKSFRSSTFTAKQSLLFLAAALPLLILFNTYALGTKGAPLRFGELSNLFEETPYEGCNNTPAVEYRPHPCEVLKEGSRGEIVLVGDSHARELENKIRSSAEDSGFRFLQNTGSACLFVEGITRDMEPRDYCFRKGNYPRSFNDWMSANSAEAENRIIVWAGRMPLVLHGEFDNQEGGVEWLNPKLWAPLRRVDPGDGRSIEEIIVSQFEFWSNNSTALVIVYPVPEVGWNVRELMLSEWRKDRNVKTYEDLVADIPNSTSLDVYRARAAKSFQILDSVRGSNIVRVYPHKQFCSEETGRCHYYSNRGIYYRDDDHVSPLGAEIIVNEFSHVFAG
jgi:peptidoglycan/LPS O-acetylase OafA/YrhL